MKKNLMLTLAFFGTAPLFATEISLEKHKTSDLPVFWTLNVNDKTPSGHTAVQAADGSFFLKLDAAKYALPLYHVNGTVPAKDGETMTLQVTAKGKGEISLGIYAYNNKNGMSYTAYAPREPLTAEKKVYKTEFQIKKPENGFGTAFLRPVITIPKGDYAEIYKVDCEVKKTPEKKTDIPDF